jgi:IPT/TIG domain
VTITGTAFTGATAVDFGTTAATNVTVVSSTEITADSPAGTGVVDVTVTTPAGTSATSAADQFTYIAAPVVTGLSPINGPVTGGTLVTITGTGFAGATAVDFGTAAATNVTVVSNTEITADSPAGTGVVQVIVTTPSGKSASSPADKFTYQVILSPTAVLDNGAWGFTSRGLWATKSGGYNGTYLTTAPATSATYAQWRLSVPAGKYDVWVTWVASSSDATNAPFQVSDNGTVLGTVSVNQTQAPFAGQYGGVYWIDLGTFTFSSGVAYVRLSANANGNLIADAVMLVPSDPPEVGIGGVGSNAIGSSVLIGPAPASVAAAPTAQKPSTSVAVPIKLMALPGVARNRLVTLQKGTTSTPSLVASQIVSTVSSPAQKNTLGSVDDIQGHPAVDVIAAAKRKK